MSERFTRRNAPRIAEFVLLLREWEDNEDMEIRALAEGQVRRNVTWVELLRQEVEAKFQRSTTQEN